jgi:catechol 2,3-dioxygenase-like lactoylglutathione lyase family enzyme
MSLTIDHAVIVVYDLERAHSDYTEMGFTVVEGGRHADGLTHNALVSFADGSYLELIAFIESPPDIHPFYRAHGAEGLVTYALLPDNIEREIDRARRKGLHLAGPLRGGRSRPDGVRIEWQTARPDTHDLPFLCADVTARELRVPYGPATLHSNGITGIAAVTVVVHDLQKSKQRYAALLGSEPLPHGPYHNARSASFQAGASVVTLVEPEQGRMLDHLRTHGEGPYALSLLAGEGRQIEPLDPDKTHGVELEVVPQGSDILGTLL